MPIRQRRLTLGGQFLLAGGAVLACATLVIGLWVTRQIEDAVIRNTAAATALYVDGLLSPVLPNLRNRAILGEGEIRAISETLTHGALEHRIVSFKLWGPGGVVIYASEPSMIGKTFEVGRGLREAWTGSVVAEFDELDHEESTLEQAKAMPLLEIYSPVREPWSGDVLAIAEFYEIANQLEKDLASSRVNSWLVVGSVTSATLLTLSGIVLRGSRTIESQRSLLERRVTELFDLLNQNRSLRIRVQHAASRSAAQNERYLRRISADLHDGPAQLIALAALRIGSQKVLQGQDLSVRDELVQIWSVLDDALREIREICSGLTVPQIESAEFGDIVKLAASMHERRTGTSVVVIGPGSSPELQSAERICIYRFLQETLNNSARHAGGADQQVVATVDGGTLSVEVSDGGKGFLPEVENKDRLGISGLRDRVESIGGGFALESSCEGTIVRMSLRIDQGRQA